ncbi:magnesium-dependent phosphatase 1 isoform X2 [Nilaparvata lugens]|uniref:magnesium-dependent phosphatase 1 isoform X2 n=1 Tax=Nilaparvata lugens TaxID=108931 RepID=UPI000B994E87|nr:magnesium-dependent phosphatase 1 isoform X2 [Nilaparvata lugens]
MARIPKLIVFDLDYTLWPFWVDTHVTPPFKKDPKTGNIIDRHGKKIKIYPEVPKMLQHLHDNNYTLGVASRTGEIEGAKSLLHLLDWDKYFKYKEIYPGDKTTHFSRFKKNTGLPYEDMLFFDDENRNIVDVSKLGATCILVQDGMSMDELDKGLKRFANKSK